MRAIGRTSDGSTAEVPGLRIPLWGNMSTEPTEIQTVTIDGENDISLLDILDHVLNSGAVIHGSLVISLAGVDLVYVGLNVILTSGETALRNMERDLPPERRR